MKKNPMTMIAIIILTFQFFVIFGIHGFSCSLVETRADEQFRANFPDAKTDDFNEFGGYDYIKIDNGSRSVIRFEVQNDLASGQEFYLKLENITQWNIAFTSSSDTMELWVEGHQTETSNIWFTSTVVGEKIIYLNVTLGNKYTITPLMIVSLPPSLTLSVDHSFLVVDAGGRADFNVSIDNNLGDPDHVELTLSTNIIEGTSATDNSWIGSLSEDSFTIPGNGMKKIVLTVFAPNFGEPKQMIVVGLGADSQNGEKEYTMEMEVVIKSNYGMLLDDAVLEKAGNPGETVIYSVGVNNTGNDEIMVTPETVSLPENWTIEFTPESAMISEEARQVFSIRVGVASRSLTGAYDVKLNFNSTGGLWEMISLEIQVNPITGLTLEKVFPYTDTLYQGDSRKMSFHLVSTSNADQELSISLASKPASINAYFTGIDTGVGSENTSMDFASLLKVEGLSGIIKPLPDQKMTELQVTLAPYQEIWVWALVDFSGVPLQSVSSAELVINGTMGSVSIIDTVQFQIMASRLDIISVTVDEQVMGEDAKVKLTENSQHTLSLLIKNKLSVKATGFTIHLSIDDEEDVVVENIDEIAPGEETSVILSWNTKSMDVAKEQMLEFTLMDQSGSEVGKGFVAIQLTEEEEETRLSTGYMILAIIFIIAIGVFVIVVIKNIKKGRKEAEPKSERRKSRKEREEDEFFKSERKTYYTKKDYESMGTSSGSRSGKVSIKDTPDGAHLSRKERLMKRSKTLKREKKVQKKIGGQ